MSAFSVDVARAVLGAEPEAFRKELRDVRAKLKGKPGKLTLEIDPKLLHAYVVQLIDAGLQTDFTDISPVPATPKKG